MWPTEWTIKLRRRRIAKFVGVCVVLLVCVGYMAKLSIKTGHRYELDSAQTPVFPCQRSAEEMKEILALFHDVLDILGEFNIRYFLVYGSIFGAYRAKGPLPWDYDIDVGIVGGEEYSEISKEKFAKTFEERNIRVNDRTVLESSYWFTRVGSLAEVDVYVFYKSNGWMQRSGLLTWLWYYYYRTYHRFPASLIEKPLPTMQFADKVMSVPRGGKTILKYFYPKDWQRIFIPAACLKDPEETNDSIR